MKKIYTLVAAAALSLGISNAQTVIFSSNLDAWAGTPLNPTDFMGSRTSIETDSVIQVSTGNQYGMYGAQLVNMQSSHKRFTTQPVSVTSGQAYEIKAYVRGAGDIRFAMYYGNYSSYSSYVNLNVTTDTVLTHTLTPNQTTTSAEFIISVRNTMLPNHIIVDSVVVSEVVVSPPASVSIYDIQNTADPNGDSPYLGQTVNTGGIVSAIRNGMDTVGFYLQSGTGPWSGIYVYHPVQSDVLSLNIGDSVTLTANVTEYYNLTELNSVQNLTVVSNGNSVQVNNVSGTDVNSESYEGVLVKVSNAVCTDPNAGFGMFKIYDNTDTVLVDDVIYSYNATLNNIYNVTGVVDYSYSEYKILPRYLSDIEDVTGVSSFVSESVKVYPNPANEVVYVKGVSGKVNVMDITGKVVKSFRVNATVVSVSVKELTQGVYFLQFENGNVVKFIKE